jgi:lipopolysaccharide biosynthesis regulator YciM
MPTESTFFVAGLLFLAAALGYVFARLGEGDEEGETREAARANFLRGFRYLLNEEPDRAVEAFTTSVDVSDEVVDTQVALGALFRRRGELERAIRLHQNLVDRPGIAAEQRDQATFALAEDFLSAGLFDRAEELFLRLRESVRHGTPALERLLRIAEVTQEWERAIELCTQIGRLDATRLRPGQLGHYHCELAERARRAGDAGAAAAAVERAVAADPGLSRAALVRADLAADAGDARGAALAYAGLIAGEPALVGDVLPRLLGALKAAPGAVDLRALLDGVAAGGPESLRRLVSAIVSVPDFTADEAWVYLERFAAGDPVLGALLEAGGAGSADTAARRDDLQRLRRSLGVLVKTMPRYQCGNCGYQSASLQWQCPGCRRWDSIRGSARLLPAHTP